MLSTIALSFRNSNLYILFLIFFTFNILLSLFIGNGLFGKFFVLVNISSSMSPTISPGDLIIIQKQDSNQYIVGDIVSFHSNRFEPNGTITHRIESILNGQFVTKGDNNTVPDKQHIIPMQIEGKVIGIIPKIGLWFNSTNSLLGKVFFLIIPMMLIIGTELINIQEYYSLKR